MDYQHRVMPFYMTYPTPYFMREEDSVIRDLDYLQQLYPAYVKQLQTKVARILDQMDYEGSLIYDEYPDKFLLYRLTDTIINVLKQEETDEEENQTCPQDWDMIKNIVQVVLYFEIYKRRHASRKRFLKF